MNFFTGVTTLLILFMEVFVTSCERARPTGMKQEISKTLEKKSSDPWDVKVLEAMEGVCKSSSFRAYTYSPPTTVKACKYLLENYDEDIEQVFTRREADPEKKICYDLTLACEGVDRTKKEKEDVNANVNGQQQNTGQDDGIQRMNVDINDPSSASRLAEQIKQQMAMQQATGGSDEDQDEDDAEEGEEDDGENLLDGYDEQGNEKPDSKDEEKPKDDDKKEENASINEKTEL